MECGFWVTREICWNLKCTLQARKIDLFLVKFFFFGGQKGRWKFEKFSEVWKLGLYYVRTIFEFEEIVWRKFWTMLPVIPGLYRPHSDLGSIQSQICHFLSAKASHSYHPSEPFLLPAGKVSLLVLAAAFHHFNPATITKKAS